MLISLDEIRIGKRLRGLRETAVAELVDSIARLGLQNPISVATGIKKREGEADGVSFTLVAGRHRLEACRRLGLAEIEASIVQFSGLDLELWEIDENLCRADLTELERGEHLARRKEVYEQLHPQTRQHVAGATAANEAMGNATTNLAVASFVADTNAKTDASETAIRRSIRRVGKIDEKVRDRIRDNPDIADSGVELDALASIAVPQQRKAVALVEAGQAGGIRDAIKLMEPKTPKPNFKPEIAADEKWWQQFLGLMTKASEANRLRAREYLDEAVADSTVALRVVE